MATQRPQVRVTFLGSGKVRVEGEGLDTPVFTVDEQGWHRWVNGAPARTSWPNMDATFYAFLGEPATPAPLVKDGAIDTDTVYDELMAAGDREAYQAEAEEPIDPAIAFYAGRQRDAAVKALEENATAFQRHVDDAIRTAASVDRSRPARATVIAQLATAEGRIETLELQLGAAQNALLAIESLVNGDGVTYYESHSGTVSILKRWRGRAAVLVAEPVKQGPLTEAGRECRGLRQALEGIIRVIGDRPWGEVQGNLLETIYRRAKRALDE